MILGINSGVLWSLVVVKNIFKLLLSSVPLPQRHKEKKKMFPDIMGNPSDPKIEVASNFGSMS